MRPRFGIHGNMSNHSELCESTLCETANLLMKYEVLDTILDCIVMKVKEISQTLNIYVTYFLIKCIQDQKKSKTRCLNWTPIGHFMNFNFVFFFEKCFKHLIFFPCSSYCSDETWDT